MPKKKYQFEVVFIKQDDGGFTAEVSALPGCISEGDTLEMAKANIHEAIELYLETLEKRGIPLPEQKKDKMVKMQIVVSRDLSKSKIAHA